MAIGTGVSLRLDHSRVAYIPGAIEAARGRFFSGGLANNREFVEGCVSFASFVPEEFRALCLDPQTSGGLLAAIAPDFAEHTLAACEHRGLPARIIGEVIPKRSPLIEII